METLNNKTTDEQIKNFMLNSTDVESWNERREQVKAIRNVTWVSQNIDSNHLIAQTEWKKRWNAEFAAR